MGVVHATITGTPVLGSTNALGSAVTPAVSSVSVIAGTENVTAQDGGAPPYTPSRFTIELDGVTFSGATFYLFISKDGLANVNTTAGDLEYAGPFAVSALGAANTVVHAGLGYGITGASYQVGDTSGHKLVTGPIPVQISTSYLYIKLYDGSCGATPAGGFCGGTGIAGAIQQTLVQPGLTSNTKAGPAWTSFQVSGGGFPANVNININFNGTYHTWHGVATKFNDSMTSSSVNTGLGFFGPVTVSISDIPQAYNSLTGPYTTVVGDITARNATATSKVLNSAQEKLSPVKFTEWVRELKQIYSYFSGTVESKSGALGNFGNATSGGVVPHAPPGSGAHAPAVDVFVTGSLGIVGGNWTVGGSVSFWIGSTQLVGSPLTATSSGGWIANVTVPKEPIGLNNVTILNDGVKYNFQIYVNPTLILTPSTGPVGTVVTATAYGFKANTWTSLWWQSEVSEDGNDYYLINSTIDITGSFNHTVTFVVPFAYGGVHEVDAVYQTAPHTPTFTSPVATSTIEASANEEADGFFTITPTLAVTPSSSPDNGTMLKVSGTGLFPGDNPGGLSCPASETCQYSVNIDHAAYEPSGSAPDEPGTFYFAANNNGTVTLWIVAAGFRPGLHVIQLNGPLGSCAYLSECETPNGVYMPTVYALFNITTTGDPIADQLIAVQSAVSGLTSSLTSITTMLGTIQTAVGNVQTSVNGITSTLANVQTSLSGITMTLGNIQTAVNGLAATISSATTGLAKTSDVTSAVSQIQSSISSAVSPLATSAQLTSAQSAITSAISSATSGLATTGNVNGAVTTLGNDISAAQSAITSGTSTAQTYVLVVAVLAAITLVLELAILVRKLS